VQTWEAIPGLPVRKMKSDRSGANRLNEEDTLSMNVESYLKDNGVSGSDGSRDQDLRDSVTVERATSIDFERVYPLLLDFNNPRITQEKWRLIFNINWESPENYCGLLLLQDGRVEGYLGLLFSARIIKGRVEKFCNMTSWIVREGCRSQSLRLLSEVLKLSDYTITNFTPSNNVTMILKRLGFMAMGTSLRILFPFPDEPLPDSRYHSTFDLEEISQKLNPADRTILSDHLRFNCRHVLVIGANDYCYLVLKNTKFQQLQFARVHYVSHPDVLLKAIDSVRTRICRQLKVAALIVDERYIGGETIRYSRPCPVQHESYFKSKSLGKTDVDTLYSELILLHD
jgi:hypothetical protein